MEMEKYMKSVIDMEQASVVICNLQHKIIYMNPAAIRRYQKHGGRELIGSKSFAEGALEILSWIVTQTSGLYNMDDFCRQRT